jgi:hypothetical protein
MKNKGNKDSNPGKRSKIGMRNRVKLTAKTVRVMIVSFVVLLATGLVLFISLTDNRSTKAAGALTGDYRSVASGNWSNIATWESYNGLIWVAAVSAPTSASGVITIQNGHIVTITTNVTVDQVVINSGGEVDLNSGITLTVANVAGTDLDVSGIFKNSGSVSINASATVAFQSGGKYQHNFTTTAGTIPTATWNSGSTCEIVGYTTNNSNPGGIGQTFANLTWNCPNQTSSFDFGASLQNISGDFTLNSTGTGILQLDAQGNNNSLTIGGNLNMNGGTIYGCMNGATTVNVNGNYIQTGGTFNFNKSGGTGYGNTSTLLSVSGNITISGGTCDVTQSTANNASLGLGRINVAGNITISGSGLITETSVDSRGQIYFTGSGTQQYITTNSSSSITQKIDFIVNSGAILRMDTQVLNSTGDFSLLSGGGLMVGHSNGITLSGASGNIQCTGTRSYSTSADYTYNGTSAQNSGDGLPATVHNLTLNNSNNLTLTNSTAVSNLLTMTSGLFVTSANTLALGTSTSTLGTLSRTSGHVYGNFKRWIAAATTSNILFPVGTLSYYNGANFSFTVAPTAGSITSTFIPTNPGTNGFPLTDGGYTLNTIGYGYWSFTGANGFAGGTYNVNLYANGFPGITDYTQLHTVRRATSGSAWTLNGTHSIGTGSNSAAVSNRTGMTLLGHFGIGSGAGNPLPIELVNFNAAPNGDKVDLTWSTASETNNDYFTVERSTDAIHFKEILRKQGAGNSTSTIYYSDIDNSPLSGHSYYRLKQTDYDGHSTYSKIKSVNNKSQREAENELKLISIAPNPFSEKFIVAFTTQKAGAATIELVNESGKMVLQQVIQSNEGPNNFNFSEGQKLTSGIYFVNLFFNGEKISQKIIKN